MIKGGISINIPNNISEKQDNRKKTTPKNKPVKIIVESVYIGGKSLNDIFFEVIYNDILKKSA